MGLFNRKNPNARAVDTSRVAKTDLPSQPATDINDPVAVRTSLSQATSPLRQQDPSTLKDAAAPVDSVAVELDPHQRLDAASAARPGGDAAAPSFPTEVSELLSSPSSLQPPAPQTDVDGLTETVLPVSEQGANGQQLPDIHDLLPAVEPDSVEEDMAVEENMAVKEEAFEELFTSPATATVSVEAPGAVVEDAVEIEVAERVTSTEQAMLFSFDISEADAEPEEALTDNVVSAPDVSSVIVADNSEPLDTELLDSGPARVDDDVIGTVLGAEPVAEMVPIADEPEPSAVDKLASVEFSPDVVQPSEDSASLSDSVESASVETAELEVSATSEPVAVVSDNLVSETALEDVASEDVVFEDAIPETPAAINPWLTAKPPAPTTDISETEDVETEDAEIEPVDTASPTKTGVVKLLFVLKPGNFHGYIAPDDGTKDILFHQKYINAEIFDCLERGTKVVATIKHIEGKVYATRVDLASS